jgi:hypothetical protein
MLELLDPVCTMKGIFYNIIKMARQVTLTESTWAEF